MPGLVYQVLSSKRALTAAAYTAVTPGAIKLKYRYGTKTGVYGLTSDITASQYSPVIKVGSSKLYIARSISSSSSTTGSTSRSRTNAPGADWSSQTIHGATYSSSATYQYASTGRTITAVTSSGTSSSIVTQTRLGYGWAVPRSVRAYTTSALNNYTSTYTITVSSNAANISYTTASTLATTRYSAASSNADAAGVYCTWYGLTTGNVSSTASSNYTSSSVRYKSSGSSNTPVQAYVNSYYSRRRSSISRVSLNPSSGTYGYSYGYANVYTYYESLTTSSANTMSTNNCNV